MYTKKESGRNLYIDNFIEQLSANIHNQKLARILFKTNEDCQEFYIKYFNRNKYLIDDLLDFREHKIKMRNIELSEFLFAVENSLHKEIFEDIFLQEFTLHDINMINESIKKGKTTFKEIFEKFKNNINENILKFI